MVRMRRHMISILVLGVMVLGGLSSVAQTSSPATQPADTRPAVVISVDGQIDDYTRKAVEKRFDEARTLGARTVILRIDTYGGLVTSAMELSAFLKRQDDLHVIAFVDDKAISAGAMIALACDEVVMAPSAKIGDAAPISVAGGMMRELPAAERAKVESPVAADFYDSAVRNGYEPQLAEAMVVVGRVVHWVEGPGGEKRFVNGEEYARLSQEGWKPVTGIRNPVDGPDSLLTVHTDQAVKLGLARSVAKNVADLAAQRNLHVVSDLSPGAGERAVAFLGGSVARAVLLVVFLLSLYVALHTPGHGMAEAVALVSLGLLISIPLLTGYAQWWEVAAIVVGLCLLALEIFVIPGFGVAGIAGTVLLLGGLVMTFVGNAPGMPGWWDLPTAQQGLRTGLTVIVSGLVATVLLAMLVRRFLPKMPVFNRLVLPTVGDAPTAEMAPGVDPNDVWPFAGTVGVAVTDLKPGGTAQFPFADDRRTTAVVSDGGFVPAGTKVLVREARGNRVVVRKAAS